MASVSEEIISKALEQQAALDDSLSLSKVIERHVISVYQKTNSIRNTARLIGRDDITVRMILAKCGVVQSSDKRAQRKTVKYK